MLCRHFLTHRSISFVIHSVGLFLLLQLPSRRANYSQIELLSGIERISCHTSKFRRMLRFSAVLAFSPYALAVTQKCVWKDGSIALGYVPCNETATSGTCCNEFEGCLSSGLCYGSVGMVYRGACINTWDPSSCMTVCDDSEYITTSHPQLIPPANFVSP